MMHSLSALLFSFFVVVAPGPGWLGVFLADADGAVVQEVIPGTPAAKAGIEAGDVLLAVDGEKTRTRDAFIAAIQGHQAGDRVRIELRRDGREQKVVVQLGERPERVGAGADVAEAPAEASSRRPPAPPAVGGAVRVPAPPAAQAVGGRPYVGVSVRETDGGVVIDRVIEDGPAARAGLHAGEVLVSVGDHRVQNLEQLDDVLSGFRAGQTVAVNVRTDDATRSVKVRLGSRPGERAGAPVRVDAVRVPATEVATEEAPMEEARSEAVVEEPIVTEGVVVEARPVPRRGARDASTRALRKELAELRKELAELREMLQELKRSEGGGRK